MTTREQLQKRIEELAGKYVQHCRNNQHSVYGIAEAYCMADFKAGANTLIDLVCELDEAFNYYIENCEVTLWEQHGGDGAPTGSLPFDEGWKTAKDTRAKIEKFAKGEK